MIQTIWDVLIDIVDISYHHVDSSDTDCDDNDDHDVDDVVDDGDVWWWRGKDRKLSDWKQIIIILKSFQRKLLYLYIVIKSAEAVLELTALMELEFKDKLKGTHTVRLEVKYLLSFGKRYKN